MNQEQKLYNQALEVIGILNAKKILLGIFPIEEKKISNVFVYGAEGYVMNKKKKKQKVIGYGVSTQSKAMALIKSLGELNERLSRRQYGLHDPEAIGSGMAAGFDLKQVVLNGLYELIERDAFMTGYINNIAPFHLRVGKEISQRFEIIKKELIKLGYTVDVFNIVNDITIPAVVVCIRKKRFLAVGLKANLKWSKAIEGAFEEALLDLILSNQNINFIKRNKNARKNPLITQEGFNKLYFSKSTIKKLFPKEIQKKNESATLKKILESKRIIYRYKDLTPGYFKKTNYVVGKIITNDLQPLFFSKENEQINKKRIEGAVNFFKKLL